MPQYDVIIIGAGPSGAIASKTCAEKGISTLLLEKKRIPRFTSFQKQLMPALIFTMRKKQYLYAKNRQR